MHQMTELLKVPRTIVRLHVAHSRVECSSCYSKHYLSSNTRYVSYTF